MRPGTIKMTGNTPIYDSLADVLKALVERFGEEIFSDRRRLISLLADHLPEAKREIRVVSSAVEEGVPSALTSAERHLSGLEMDRQAGRLEAGTGLRIDIARQVVRAFAYSLGLGPLPSVYETPAARKPTEKVPEDDWAGLSQPVNSDTNQQRAQNSSHTGTTNTRKKKPKPKPANTINIGNFSVDRKYAFMALGAIVIGVGLQEQMSGGGGEMPQPQPVENDPSEITEAPIDNTSYAGELVDRGVRAKSTLESNVGSPTPMSIPVGRRVTTHEVRDMVARGGSIKLIDVLGNAHSNTIRGAAYLPMGGYGGTFNDNYQRSFVSSLRSLFGGKTSVPTIFFCAGSECWESYNAVLRANAAGYTNLYWYRGGLASWATAGLPMEPTPQAR